VNGCPAIVTVAVRLAGPVLAPIDSDTMPLPTPLAPLPTVIHDGASFPAVHAQPSAVVTVTFAAPAAEVVESPDTSI
jgi:hypothetical protein